MLTTAWCVSLTVPEPTQPLPRVSSAGSETRCAMCQPDLGLVQGRPCTLPPRAWSVADNGHILLSDYMSQ